MASKIDFDDTIKLDTQIVQLGKYVVFDPRELAKFLCCDVKNLSDKVRAYVVEHPEVKVLKDVPKSYMLGNVINNDYDNEIRKYKNFESCIDYGILINVLCKTFDGLYIPSRPLNFDKERFYNVVVFLYSEVHAEWK